jgi:hypothetical protein
MTSLLPADRYHRQSPGFSYFTFSNRGTVNVRLNFNFQKKNDMHIKPSFIPFSFGNLFEFTCWLPKRLNEVECIR